MSVASCIVGVSGLIFSGSKLKESRIAGKTPAQQFGGELVERASEPGV